MPAARPEFPPTRWSVVAQAADARSAPARAALGELCRLYWYPLYAYARRMGHAPEEAEDRTQDFFAVLLEENLLARADQTAGKLRTFLLAAFSRDLSDARKAERRQKRGGGVEFVSFDPAEAEERYRTAGASDTEPDAALDRDWAVTVLDAAMARLETDYQETDRGAVFTALRPFITAGAELPDTSSIGERLGMTAGNVRLAVHRLRERFREALRAQIADTLREPTEEAIGDELLALRAALRG